MVYYALDCEMVSGYGKNLPARVSVVDQNYNVVYDVIVRQNPNDVRHYQTDIHGITPSQIANGKEFGEVLQQVKTHINSGTLLVGHSLDVDLAVLGIQVSSQYLRDVATYPPFQKYNIGYRPSLKDLARNELNKVIQQGVHSSVEDAIICMELYNKVKRNWN